GITSCTIFSRLCHIGNGLFCLVQTIRRNTGEALDALHLMPFVESLRETNDAFGVAFLKRNDDWARKERPNSRVIRKSVDEAVKLLMGMPVSCAELDGQSGYTEPIGELDRLLVYYRRTVAVRKGRRSAAKERVKSRKHRSNADMQGSHEKQEKQETQERGIMAIQPSISTCDRSTVGT
ncbi:MAG: DUF6261 family protein, partial [Dysgonamonadaceae bacterium]